MCNLDVKGNVEIFSNPEFGRVRVIMRDGEPWFVGTDVAEVLGYADASRAIVQHCKKSIKSTILVNNTNGKGTPLNQSIIPESDVYRLIMRSNMPKAIEFQDWVMEEVLPSIRKTGAYSIIQARVLALEEANNHLKAANKSLWDEAKLWCGLSQTFQERAERYKKERARISSEREAKLMRENGLLKKEIEELKNRYGKGKDWMRVAAIPWLLDVFHDSSEMRTIVGIELTSLSKKMNKAIKHIGEPPAGTRRVYHRAVIEAFKFKLSWNPDYLKRYRIKGGSCNVRVA